MRVRFAGLLSPLRAEGALGSGLGRGDAVAEAEAEAAAGALNAAGRRDAVGAADAGLLAEDGTRPTRGRKGGLADEAVGPLPTGKEGFLKAWAAGATCGRGA
jgi:hypothetical protein